MTWDDTDRTELDKAMDEIEENAYQVGIIVGKTTERQAIIELLQLEASEGLSRDEVLRLIKKIEDRL